MMRRWILLLLLLAGAFAGLRGVHALVDEPAEPQLFDRPVVVVGVTDRTRLTGVDVLALESHLDDAQVAMMSTRARYVGSCAAAGWTTLGAGRRAAVGDRCAPEVVDGRVVDWSQRVEAAAADSGDARLGTLQASAPGCVAAVGPGAALAAADPTGALQSYRTVAQFQAGGLRTSCPVTLVDAGNRSDALISELAGRTDLTLIVTGIGPPPGSADPSLQVVYRLGAAESGWLTSASTRRQGIVTLTDLTRTLVDHARSYDPHDQHGAVPSEVDGSPLAVDPAPLTVRAVERHIASVTALSDAVITGYRSLAVSGTALFALLVVSLARRRWRVPTVILTYGSVVPAVTMLTGALPWSATPWPGPAAALAVHLWAAALTVAALLLSAGAKNAGRLPDPGPRSRNLPAIFPNPLVAGAVLSVVAFTVDAALGGPMQAGSLINSRPIYGLRWYGFGNVTFAGYAASGLLVAGYLAHRLLDQGRRRAAGAVVAVIGFGVVLCEGWPSMGSDFGGVIALTPPVLWLVLVVSGVRITWPRFFVVGASAVVAVGLISWLDWSRGPDRRSHLGNFVQRVLDGDALDVVVRKAVASAETITGPVGIGCLVLGIPLWILILRVAVPRLTEGFSTLRPVLTACLATGVLGTLLNDGGIYVFLTITGWVTAVVLGLLLDRAQRSGWTETGPPGLRR